MKNSLPQIKNISTKGFTLVELMVVITIIAILAVAGLTLFTNATRNARDSKRTQDAKAIAVALESHYIASGNAVPCNGVGSATANSGQYCPLYGVFFGNAVLPADPQSGSNYCFYTSVAAGAITNPAVWATGAVCPAAAGGTTNTLANPPGAGPIPAAAYNKFKICVSLENNGTQTVFCEPSTQGG